MGWGLLMSAEIRDWLHDLRDTDPRAARLAGTALAALASEGPGLGPPLVVTLAEVLPEVSPPEGLDQAYQVWLERMTLLRRRVADAATLADDIRTQIGVLEAQREQLSGRPRDAAGGGGHTGRAGEAGTAARLTALDEEMASLRRLLPGVVAAAQKLTAQSQRAQAQMEAFRTRKETLKARHVAALAELSLREIFGADGEASGLLEDFPAEAAAAAGKLEQIEAEIERELRAGPQQRSRLAPGLLELRPAAPGPHETGILCAAEPPGAVLLLAVLDGPAAVRDRYEEAVLAASELLRQSRAGHAPEAAAHSFSDVDSFLAEFFPDDAAGLAAAAADLADRNRGRTLAQQRLQLGLTQAQVAARMRVSPERVAAIEHAGPGATEVRALAGYVDALGGRLEITADFGGERTVLR